MASKRTRSAISRFTGRVTVPIGILALAWAGLTAATLTGAFGSPPRWLADVPSGQRIHVEIASIAGVAFVIIVLALVLAASFVRRLAREANNLSAAARRITDVRLPAELQALRAGGDAASLAQADPAPVTSRSAESARVAVAIADLHRSALAAAAGEASLRDGLRQVLVSLGRRNQSLVHRQLRIIDKLEKQASGSAELGDLFTLDHLTTRMRRHAESLTVLAGEAPSRSWSTPVPVIDVMRAAAAEVEDYKRVTVRSDAEQAIAAPAVTDMIHLLAELIENATLFSPSNTKVEVRAEPVANGFVIEIEDRGLGIPADQLREINARLADPPDENLADADRLGLFVAARLAARNGVQVSLNPSAYRGTKAVVVLPDSVIMAAQPDSAGPGGIQVTAPGGGRGSAPGRLNLQAPEVLALAATNLTAPAPQVPRPQPVKTQPVKTQPVQEQPLSAPYDLEDPQAPQDPGAGPGHDEPLGGDRQGSGNRQGIASPDGGKLPRRPSPPGWDDLPQHAARVSGGFPRVADTGKGDRAQPAPEAPAKPGLPRRVRPAQPRLAPRQAHSDSPLPDQARSLASSLQNNWRRAQQDNDGEA
ncbi:MAG: hypothetical protein J2P25_07415 [Nocardiopsaceae bacterium]|nr:hypothetical protein [Nocardiopsaceae bacterium]